MSKFVDVATLCNFCILSNVLDPRTYNFDDIPYGRTANAIHLAQRHQHDYNALSPRDRLYFSYVRGLSINLIHWVKCNYMFKDKEGHPVDFVALSRTYLHQQVRAIIKYKQRAEKETIQGIPNCSSSDLIRQVELLFAEGMEEFAGLSISVADMKDTTSLSWDPEVTPIKRKQPLLFTGTRYLLSLRTSH
jgi:hypothetical protein